MSALACIEEGDRYFRLVGLGVGFPFHIKWSRAVL